MEVEGQPIIQKNNFFRIRLNSYPFYCDFSQLSTQRVRNKKLPAMRVGNNRLYQKSPQYYNRVVQT